MSASEAQNPPEAEAGEEREDEIEQARALHAKVIALDDGKHSTVIVGSNNLTGSSWCGRNTEAFVRIVGDAALCDPLWDWAGAQAQLFDFPELGTPSPKKPILEQVKDELHAVHFRLEDVGERTPLRLIMLDPSRLELREGVRLEVARYSTPRATVRFPAGTSTVNIPGCATALRTRFVVCTLRHGDDETGWIASVDLEPPLGNERDHELVARLLGLRDFLVYLQSLRTDEAIPGTIEGNPADGAREASQSRQSALADRPHLEGLLRQLVGNPEAFHEMDLAVVRYGKLINNGQMSPDELALLGRFLDAWAAICEAFHP